MTLQEEKKALRRAIKQQTAALSTEEMACQAAEVFAAIERLPEFAAASTVGLFWSLPDELPTHDIVRRWAAAGKRIALPVTEGVEMIFREFHPEAGLKPGAFGIAEPDTAQIFAPEEFDLLIVPGVAFTADGCRMGRGKGFYDRYLPCCRALTIGVCLRHQLVAGLPCEAHDYRLDRVVCATNTKG